MISARMRVGATWGDACILNLSSRGMLVHAPQAPPRGSYLELRRGAHVVVARVVWSNADRFGVRTQDHVSAEALINESTRSPVGQQQAASVERRAVPRQPERGHEASRWRARSAEFMTFAALGGIGALALVGMVGELLAAPLAMVQSALRSG